MSESLFIAATGMHAQQTNIDVIANNLANVNTMGYKKSRASFEDLMYRQGPHSANAATGEVDQFVGVGTGIGQVNKLFQVGELKKTERSFDVAIRGEGFFEVSLPDGTNAYTRAGTLQRDKDGWLVNTDGHVLTSMIQVPADAQDIVIQSDGKVLAKMPNETDLAEVGKIELAKFVNDSGLTPVGDNLYLPSQRSGDPIYGHPNQDGFGGLSQGYLEASNVNLIEELTNLMLAQRAYEINSKVVQASDELLGLANNLRR